MSQVSAGAPQFGGSMTGLWVQVKGGNTSSYAAPPHPRLSHHTEPHWLRPSGPTLPAVAPSHRTPPGPALQPPSLPQGYFPSPPPPSLHPKLCLSPSWAPTEDSLRGKVILPNWEVSHKEPTSSSQQAKCEPGPGQQAAWPLTGDSVCLQAPIFLG